MKRPSLAPLLFFLLCVASCGTDEKVLGSGAPLTTIACDQCAADAQPRMSCAEGQQVGCFKRTDGTCGWADKCGPKPTPPDPTPTCPTDQVCAAILCEYGNQVDEKGCPTCACNPAPNPCATALCPADTHCVAKQVTCIKAPCPPVAECVPNEPKPDGCAAALCPAGTRCVSEPVTCIKAPCDPVIKCVPEEKPPLDPCATVLCAPGTRCTVLKTNPPQASCQPEDPAPSPCAAILCPVGTICKAQEVVCIKAPCPPQAECVPVAPTDGCATVRCAKGTHCELEEVVCIKAPCPPQPRCVPDPPPVPCGGFAGRVCPGAGKCIDDPTDSCDPARGGADCGGLCTCSVAASCPAGQKWDSSPKVCGCAPIGACGNKICGDTEFCCNPSCGVCAPKGGACDAIACVPPV